MNVGGNETKTKETQKKIQHSFHFQLATLGLPSLREILEWDYIEIRIIKE